MIMYIVPLAVGNALRVFLDPPAGAKSWRVLRKDADTFTGHNDAQALIIFAGESQKAILDYKFLENGSTYYYRAYYWDGANWIGSATVSAAPAALYEDASTDALSVVRDRLDDGLRVEVARGKLSNDAGAIRVLTAPPIFEDTRWPVVTVHLQSEAPFARGIGEMVEPDDFMELDGDWGSVEGWMAKVQLTIVGWSLNPDERQELRKALRRIIVANLPVFDESGMVDIEFSMQDMEDFASYGAPVYQVMCSFTCVAPVRVLNARDSAIADVQSSYIEG